MPASLTRVALVTQEFRWDLQVDLAVPRRRLQARVMDAESYCSTQQGASVINSAIFAIMKGDNQLIQVPVNPMPDGLSFAQLAPTVRLEYPPLGLSRDMLIVGRTEEVRRDGLLRGELLLW